MEALYHFNQLHYVTLTVLMCIVAVLKALFFYNIVQVFHHNKINLERPFNQFLAKFILTMASFAFGIGLFAYWGKDFTKFLLE